MLHEHKPVRTCVVCKGKDYQENLLRLQVIEQEIVFDSQRRLPGRGYYVCDNDQCIEKLSTWKQKRLKRLQKKQKLK